MTAQSALSGEYVILASYVLFLLVIPRITIDLFGLADDATTFWPRVLGAGALGILLGVIGQQRGWTTSGIGLGGCVAINLTLAVGLAAMMLVGPKMPTTRGTLTIWGMAASHLMLGLAQRPFA